jgi:hypothetical protein
MPSSSEPRHSSRSEGVRQQNGGIYFFAAKSLNRSAAIREWSTAACFEGPDFVEPSGTFENTSYGWFADPNHADISAIEVAKGA